MWGEAFILLLWATDKNLLSRLGTFLASTFKRGMWSALTLYSNWKSTNDMIKDGYHVDEVFLLETKGVREETRAIDVLRVFRQQIQSQTFTNIKKIKLTDFIGLCCEPDSNFTEYDRNARYELVVSYTFDHKHYKIVYGTDPDSKTEGGAAIRFPIYSEEHIRKNSKFNNTIVAAMLTLDPNAEEGIDIFNQLSMLAGPMNNFYADTEYAVKKHHLHYTGIRTPIDEMYIKIIDFNGDEFTVRPDRTVIKLEK